MLPRFSNALRQTLMPIYGGALVLACGLGTQTVSDASPTPKIEQISPNAITVDGKLDESLYATGEWNSGFTVVRSRDKARNQTAFRLFSDGRNLYFSARMHKNGGEFHSGGDGRDGVPLHSGDNINLFFRATDDPTEYLQFLITPTGGIADIRLTQSGVTKEYSWNTDVIAASHVDAKAQMWTVEMVLPLASLNIDPTVKVWHANVGRLTVRQPKEDGGPREFNSWIPTSTEIENASCLAPFSLPEFERAVFGWSLRPSPLRVVKREGAFYLSTAVEITNQTGAERAVTLRSQLDGVKDARSEQAVTLAAGEVREVATLTPLGERAEGAGLFRLSITGGADKQLWALQTEEIAFAYAPAILRLIDPGYRATLFATQKLKTLRAELVRWDRYAVIDDIKASLIAQDGTHHAATVTTESAAASPAEQWQIAVEGIDQLPDGNYRLEVSFSAGKDEGRTGGLTQTLTREVRKVPYQPGEMWIDQHGVVYRDGKAFQSYGFHYGRRDSTAEVQGFIPGMFYNTYLPVWVRPPYKAADVESIGNLARHQIFSVVNVLPVLNGGLEKNEKDELTDKERKAFRDLALAMRDNPNVVGYYLADEPEYRGMTPHRLRQVYEVLREADPYHPVIITNNTDEAVRNYQQCSDIHNPDPYPLFLTGMGPARHFSRIGAHLDNVQLGEESYRALWITPQGFDLRPFRPGEGGHRGPTAIEMRAQQVISLIHRAVGVTWYTEEYAWEEPGITSSLPYLSQEYVWLFPHIIAGRPQQLDTPRSVTASISATDKGTVIMLVNLEREVTEVTLRDPRLAATKGWHYLGGEGKTLLGGAESLHLRLEPHETVILASESLPLPETLPSWSSVLEEEKRLFEAIDRSPENIALESNGSKASAIGRAAWQGSLVINGIRELRSVGFYQPRFKKGMGVEITFPEEKTPQRLVLVGSNILTGVVQVQADAEGSKWLEVARINNVSAVDELTLPLEAKKARRLRIVAETVAPITVEGLRVVQVAIYEK